MLYVYIFFSHFDCPCYLIKRELFAPHTEGIKVSFWSERMHWVWALLYKVQIRDWQLLYLKPGFGKIISGVFASLSFLLIPLLLFYLTFPFSSKAIKIYQQLWKHPGIFSISLVNILCIFEFPGKGIVISSMHSKSPW